MDRFDFLIGSWDMEYQIPQTDLNEAGTDRGVGRYRRAMNDKYVFFDYSTLSGSEAKGIFAKDESIEGYRYWWFENSGDYLSATCNFIDDNTLAMNWHDTLLVQTYVRESDERIVLKMQRPAINGGYELVLKVIFTKIDETAEE